MRKWSSTEQHASEIWVGWEMGQDNEWEVMKFWSDLVKGCVVSELSMFKSPQATTRLRDSSRDSNMVPFEGDTYSKMQRRSRSL